MLWSRYAASPRGGITASRLTACPAAQRLSGETGVEIAKLRKWFDNRKQKYRRAKEAEAKSPRSKKQTSDLVQQASRDAISAPTGTPRLIPLVPRWSETAPLRHSLTVCSAGPLPVKMAARFFQKAAKVDCPVCGTSLRSPRQCEVLTCSSCSSTLAPQKHEQGSSAMVLRLPPAKERVGEKERARALEQAIETLADQVRSNCAAVTAAQAELSFENYERLAKQASTKTLARITAVHRLISGQEPMLQTNTIICLDALSKAFHLGWQEDAWGPGKLPSGWRARVVRQLQMIWHRCLIIMAKDPRFSQRGRKQLVTVNLEKLFGKSFVANPKYSAFLTQQRRLWPRQDSPERGVDSKPGEAVGIPVAMLQQLVRPMLQPPFTRNTC